MDQALDLSPQMCQFTRLQHVTEVQWFLNSPNRYKGRGYMADLRQLKQSIFCALACENGCEGHPEAARCQATDVTSASCVPLASGDIFSYEMQCFSYSGFALSRHMLASLVFVHLQTLYMKIIAFVKVMCSSPISRDKQLAEWQR